MNKERKELHRFFNRGTHKITAILVGLTLLNMSPGVVPLRAQEAKAGTVVAIAAGEQISIALNDKGELFTWGYNWNGQLGDGLDGWGYAKPKPGLVLKNVVAVSSGAGHTLALTTDNRLFAFGFGWDGQNGTGAAGMRSQLRNPTPIMKDILTMSAGAAHSLVVTTGGTLYAFGRNRHGELGLGTTISQTRPQIVVPEGVVAVSAGDRHSLAIMEDDSLWAWGDNYAGQLGTGDTEKVFLPKKIMDNIKSAYAGRINSFAIDNDGTLWGWGKNISTLLFEKADPEQLLLTPLKIMANVKEIAIGAAHLLILQENGVLLAAGENWLGQLGLPMSATLIPMPLRNQIAKVAAGGWHSLALDTSGNLFSWGDNTYGQLGNMSFDTIYAPTLVNIGSLPPSVLFNDSDIGWREVTPILAVDRVVLPLESAFAVLKIDYNIVMGSVLQFTYKGDSYLHLVGSRVFYKNGKKSAFPMTTFLYRGEIVFQAYDLATLFDYTVRWDTTSQLLIINE